MWNEFTTRVAMAIVAMRDEEGQALVEYGLLVGLIAVVCVVAVGVLGGQVNDAFNAITTALGG
jgi:pilus assembly protein Flp/PilA